MGCPRCRKGEDSIESKIGNVRRRLKSKDAIFKKSSLSGPLTDWVTDRLKTCEKLQNRKQSVAHQPALRVHNAQNRDKRGEEVFCLAPKAAVTHGLSVNYTWVTAVPIAMWPMGLKLVKNCKIGKQSVAHQPLAFIMHKTGIKGSGSVLLVPHAAVTHGLLVNYRWVTAVIDRLQSETFRTFMCFNASGVHNSVIFGIPYISHPSAC